MFRTNLTITPFYTLLYKLIRPKGFYFVWRRCFCHIVNYYSINNRVFFEYFFDFVMGPTYLPKF